MKNELDQDIPGSRMAIADVASRFNVTFLFVMSMLGAVVFLFGMYQTNVNQFKNVPEPVLLICVGMGGFSLFFPWYTAVFFARHFLHSVRDLEGRLERLERDQKPRKKVETPWQEDDELM